MKIIPFKKRFEKKDELIAFLELQFVELKRLDFMIEQKLTKSDKKIKQKNIE